MVTSQMSSSGSNSGRESQDESSSLYFPHRHASQQQCPDIRSTDDQDLDLSGPSSILGAFPDCNQQTRSWSGWVIYMLLARVWHAGASKQLEALDLQWSNLPPWTDSHRCSTYPRFSSQTSAPRMSLSISAPSELTQLNQRVLDTLGGHSPSWCRPFAHMRNANGLTRPLEGVTDHPTRDSRGANPRRWQMGYGGFSALHGHLQREVGQLYGCSIGGQKRGPSILRMFRDPRAPTKTTSEPIYISTSGRDQTRSCARCDMLQTVGRLTPSHSATCCRGQPPTGPSGKRTAYVRK